MMMTPFPGLLSGASVFFLLLAFLPLKCLAQTQLLGQHLSHGFFFAPTLSSVCQAAADDKCRSLRAFLATQCDFF